MNFLRIKLVYLYSWSIFLPLILVFISWLNVYPPHSFFASGDFIELKNYSNYSYYFSTMSSTSIGFPSYNSTDLFTWINVRTNALLPEQLNGLSYSLFFLLGSFYAFVFSVKPLLRTLRIQVDIRNIYVFAFFFALNPYTSFRLSDPTGFYYPYIFFPLVLSFFIIYFVRGRAVSLDLLFYAISLVLFSFSADNPAYMSGLVIALGLFSILLIFYEKMTFTSWLTKTSILFLVSCMALIMYAIPVYMLVSEMNVSGHVTDSWLLSQSLSFLEAYSLGTSPIYNHNNLSYLIVSFSSILLIILFAISLFYSIRKEKIILIISLALVIMFLILTRGKGIVFLHYTILDLYKDNIFLGSIRSFDKTLFIIPFLIILTMLLSKFTNNNYKRFFIIFLALISSFPASLGLYHSDYFRDKNDKNHLTKSFIKTPSEIIKINKVLTKENPDVLPRILELPNHPGSWDLSGWVYNQKMRLWGVNPLYNLLDATVLAPTIPNILLEGIRNEKELTTESLYAALDILDINYILMNNYIHNDSYSIMSMIDELSASRRVELIDKYKLYSLYRVNYSHPKASVRIPGNVVFSGNNLVLTKQYGKNNSVYVDWSTCDKESIDKDLYSKIYSFDVERKTPTNYTISINKSKDNGFFALYFNKKYSSNWVLKNSNSDHIQSTHCMGNGYANVWLINQSDICTDVNNKECRIILKMSYKPEEYLLIGRRIFFIALALVSIIILFSLFSRKIRTT